MDSPGWNDWEHFAQIFVGSDMTAAAATAAIDASTNSKLGSAFDVMCVESKYNKIY